MSDYRRAQSPGGVYFFTHVTLGRRPILTQVSALDALRSAIETTRKTKPFVIDAIHDDEDWIQHRDYVHYNPVKHGLAAAAIDWPHSSIHRYVAQGLYPRVDRFPPQRGHSRKQLG